LPKYYNNGYALEASTTYLQNLFISKDILKVAAVSKKDNKPSIKLLKKLGFEFSNEIEYKKESIQIFVLTRKKLITKP